MEEEALAAIEEASADDVVVEEGEAGLRRVLVKKASGVAAGLAAAQHERDAGGAVAAHVLLVEGQRGILVVEQIAAESAGGAVGFGGRVGLGVLAKAREALAEETQLAVGIEAAVAHPAAEDQIEARHGVAAKLGLGLEQCLDLGGELGA